MHRTRWTTLLACFLLLAVLSGAGYDLSLRHHGWVPAVSLWGGAAVLVMTLVVLVAGRGVRRLRAHEPTWMTPPSPPAWARPRSAGSTSGRWCVPWSTAGRPP